MSFSRCISVISLHSYHFAFLEEGWVMGYASLLLCVLGTWLCIPVVLVLFFSRKRPGHGSLPAGPRPLPIQQAQPVTCAALKDIRPTDDTEAVKLGGVTAVVVSSPHMAREILQKHDQDLSGRGVVDAVRALDYHEASVAWVPPDARRRRLRMLMLCNTRILTIFTTQRLDASRRLRQEKVDELIAHVREKCRAGEAQIAFATALNLISNTVFSVDMVDILFSDSAQKFRDCAGN
ncbi:hypothetical protein ACLOJK_033536 [Asimina triloba]